MPMSLSLFIKADIAAELAKVISLMSISFKLYCIRE